MRKTGGCYRMVMVLSILLIVILGIIIAVFVNIAMWLLEERSLNKFNKEFIKEYTERKEDK